jgi:tetratricopeptide (TPR) repeat protein
MAERTNAAGPNFFVSYTQADRAWAEWIAWQLEAAGYSTVLQAWDFVPGSDWVHEMQHATAASPRMIAVLSPAYLESAYGEAEWRTAFANDPSGELGLLVPVRVEEVRPPGLLRTRVYVDLVGLNRQTARARLLEAIGHERPKPDREPPFPGPLGGARATSGREPDFPGRGPEITNLPPRNPDFVGRAELLELLHQEFRARTGVAVTQARAVHGLGGVGKTQLVLEYAHRHASDYDLVWWIVAERAPTAVAALTALGRHLGVGEAADQNAMVDEILDRLRHRDRWLLIYDNADEPEQLARLLPPGGSGHVLVTSRCRAWGRVAEPLPLDVLRRHESVALLRRRSGSGDEASLMALAELLGDLPLALEEAAAYIEESQIDLTEYLELARSRMVELLGLEQPVGDEHRVAATWSVSLERVRAQVPAAEALLSLCGFLAPSDIPRELAQDDPELLPEPLCGAARDPLIYNEAVRVLGRYSLAVVTHSSLGVHPLVQAVVRTRLGPEDEQRWAGTVVRLLAERFPDRSWEVAAWSTCQRLLPHVLAATEHAQRLDVSREEGGWLLDRAAAYLQGRGQPRQARPVAERALAMTRAALGPDNPATGQRHAALGRVLQELGELAPARAQLERALAILEATLGPDHPEVGMLGAKLGGVLLELGDLPGARMRLQRALTILEATLGPDHPEVGGVHNQIAHLLRERWDLVGARAQLERALVIYEANFGPDHRAVATVRGNLGSILQDLANQAGARDDLEQARAELERALAIMRATLGPDHPEVGMLGAKLGGVLLELGDLSGAREQLQRALTAVEAALGPDHRDVAIFSAKLGDVLRRLGDLPGAREQLQRALNIFEAASEPERQEVALLRANLQRVLRDLAEGDDPGRESPLTV